MPSIEALLRELAPQVLGLLVHRYGGFDTCEDAVQEALLAAAVRWPTEGVPDNPKGWLITVAARRRTELWRNETARRRREDTAAALAPPDPEPIPAVDDTLTLLLLCCHPSLSTASKVALTLRAVGGLTTAEIARALLVPVSTVGQRISRAKQQIKASGAQFRIPDEADRPERIAAVLHVLYLIFNEGYTASSGSALHRVELSTEAIRLTRQLRDRLPEDGEVAGLLALMLLTDARRPARTGPGGGLVPLAEQDRDRWDSEVIAEGVRLITETLATAPIGPYQLQAADRCGTRRGGELPGHRLEADSRALRPVGRHCAGTDGRAEPHRCPSHGSRSPGRAGTARRCRGRPRARRAPPGRRRTRTSTRPRGRSRGGACGVRVGRTQH